MRASIFLLAFLAACSGSRSEIRREDGADFSRLRRIGVPSFKDPSGHGDLIADRVSEGLQRKLYEPVDRKALEEVLAKYKLDTRVGLGAEALQDIQSHTPADAILYGRVAPDRRSALVTLVETDMGQPIMQAVIRPKRRIFFEPEEIGDEVLRVIVGLR